MTTESGKCLGDGSVSGRVIYPVDVVCTNMVHQIVRELLDRNRDHTDSLPAGHFDAVQTRQEPVIVSVCCSDSRVSQGGMFDVREPGYLFTSSNIGNQTGDEYEGEAVVDGNLMFPIHYTGTKVVAVVGHTRCGAVTAAYRWASEGEEVDQPGVRKRVEQLLPIVEDGLGSDRIDADAEPAAVIDQLVEYNVERQVSFLLDHADLPDDISVYGFVYDFHGVYGDVAGRTYAVNVDGETAPSAIRDQIPEGYEEFVQSLLDTA